MVVNDFEKRLIVEEQRRCRKPTKLFVLENKMRVYLCFQGKFGLLCACLVAFMI